MRSSKSVALWVGSFGVVGLGTTHAFAQVNVPILNDTFIDSSAPGYFPAGDTTVDEQSYGANTKVKVVSSATENANSSGQTISYTHTLFQIPSIVITDWQGGLLSSVTVNYYPVNDSLATSSAQSFNDGDTYMNLYPLTHSFTIGNGTQPGTNMTESSTYASTTGGATWATYDGNVADTWTTPGGDYASDHVSDTNTTLPASNGTVPFTWNITSLLQNSADEADLAAYGALIRLPNEPVSAYQLSAMVQDFTSLDSADASSNTPFITLTFVPEPASAATGLLVMSMGLMRRRSRRKTCESL